MEHTQNKKIKKFPLLFLTIYLFFANSSLATLASLGGAEEDGGVFILVWAIAYILTVFFIIVSSKRFILYKDEIFVYALMLYIFISLFWSSIPSESLKYSLSLILNILFALYCARSFPLDTFLKYLAVSLNISIAAGLFLAAVGIDIAYYHDGLGRLNVLGTHPIEGLFSHKIYAGFYSSIAFFLNLLVLRGVYKYLLCIVCFFSMLVSGSSIGIVSFLLGFFVLTYLKFFSISKVRQIFLIPILIAFFITIFVASSFYIEIFELLGRDPTLTGRTDLWSWAFKFWTDKPVAGWGYAGIFSDIPDSPSRIINEGEYYKAPHFHNGYLQILAELGIIGFIFFIMIIFANVKNSINSYWITKNNNFLAVAIIVILIISIATTMNLLVRYNELSTILMIYFFLAWKKCKQSSVPIN